MFYLVAGNRVVDILVGKFEKSLLCCSISYRTQMVDRGTRACGRGVVDNDGDEAEYSDEKKCDVRESI